MADPSFLILHARDGEQLLIPRSFLPEYQTAHSDVQLDHPTPLVKSLVTHLIERSKVSGDGHLQMDRRWFNTLDPSQYVAMASLTTELQLSWASALIVAHVASQLRRPNLDWSQVEQTWKRLG